MAKASEPEFYIAGADLENGKTGEKYKEGDPVPAGAFTQDVKRAWLKQGILLMPDAPAAENGGGDGSDS